ncbi:MAG: NAD(P)/FAD-dependent oxidoreductase, partial [Aurantibacter sp.]
MNLSYWEYKTWLSNIDYTIVGSGIVGLNCALYLKASFPKAKILILEKGVLPQGASTKNAGFACYGSISEILADLEHNSEEEVIQLVQRRLDGIRLLRKNLGDSNIDFRNDGGHEVFLSTQEELFNECQGKLDRVNELLFPIFGKNGFELQPNKFGFKGVQEQYITNTSESQLDTGKMMAALLAKVQKRGVILLNSIVVEDFSENNDLVFVKTNQFEFATRKLFFATNGFASQLLNEEVRPARAQVLITKPIENLGIKGTFHLEQGYYYFRDIDNRILLGGGRNLDFKGEETANPGRTQIIQNKLEQLLSEVILTTTPHEIEHRWSGIMGIGEKKRPIVKQLSLNVYCG